LNEKRREEEAKKQWKKEMKQKAPRASSKNEIIAIIDKIRVNIRDNRLKQLVLILLFENDTIYIHV
jgi:hypothetical protein